MVNPNAALFGREDGSRMEFHVSGVTYQERVRVMRRILECGGELVTNPARSPHALTLIEAEPGSRPRLALSQQPDEFSIRYIDDCVRDGMVHDIVPYRVQPRSLYADPSAVTRVLYGEERLESLRPAAAVRPGSDDDEDVQLLQREAELHPEPRGRAGTVLKGRIKFTEAEDSDIVRAVGELGHRDLYPPTAPRFWQLCHSRLPEVLQRHPPASLWTRFVKQIRPRLSEFKSTLTLQEVLAAARSVGDSLPLTEDERAEAERSDREAATGLFALRQRRALLSERRGHPEQHQGEHSRSGTERSGDEEEQQQGEHSRSGTERSGDEETEGRSGAEQSGAGKSVETPIPESAFVSDGSETEVEMKMSDVLDCSAVTVVLPKRPPFRRRPRPPELNSTAEEEIWADWHHSPSPSRPPPAAGPADTAKPSDPGGGDGQPAAEGAGPAAAGTSPVMPGSSVPAQSDGAGAPVGGMSTDAVHPSVPTQSDGESRPSLVRKLRNWRRPSKEAVPSSCGVQRQDGRRPGTAEPLRRSPRKAAHQEGAAAQRQGALRSDTGCSPVRARRVSEAGQSDASSASGEPDGSSPDTCSASAAAGASSRASERVSVSVTCPRLGEDPSSAGPSRSAQPPPRRRGARCPRPPTETETSCDSEPAADRRERQQVLQQPGPSGLQRRPRKLRRGSDGPVYDITFCSSSDEEDDLSDRERRRQRRSTPRTAGKRRASSTGSRKQEASGAVPREDSASSGGGSPGAGSRRRRAGSGRSGQRAVAVRPGGPRSYSPREDAVLVREVLRRAEDGTATIRGRSLYQQIEESEELPGRTWMSLRERLLKYLLPRLDDQTGLRPSQRTKLRQLAADSTRGHRTPRGPRQPYSRDEDLLMLRFIQQVPRRVRALRGNTLWKDMARHMPGRSWHSLKERFLKRVAGDLSRFSEVPADLRRAIEDQLSSAGRD